MHLLRASAALASFAAVANAGACYPCRKLSCAVALRAAGITDKSSLAYSECAAAVAHSAPAATSTVTTTAYADPSHDSVTVTSTSTAPTDTTTATVTASTTASVVRVVEYIDPLKRRTVPTLAVPAYLEVSCASYSDYLSGCACFGVQPTTTVTTTVSRGPTATVTATSSVTSTLSLGPTTTVTSTASAVVTSTPPADTVTATTTVVAQTQTATLSSFLLQPTDEPDAYIGQKTYGGGTEAFHIVVRDRALAVPCTFHSQFPYESVVCGGFIWVQTDFQDDIYGITAAAFANAGVDKFSCAFDGQGLLSCSSPSTGGLRTSMRYVNDGRRPDLALVTPDAGMRGYKEVVLRAVPV
ncbi:hypothetical protein PG985_010421 [Apiospora marii]|uniref:Uncharacterized protein n=1 Tax=Apiospora marii TaxID=335849 RepID=A0ABR1RZ75_9PEZI